MLQIWTGAKSASDRMRDVGPHPFAGAPGSKSIHFFATRFRTAVLIVSTPFSMLGCTDGQ